MALIKCKECGKEMSDTIKKCPHCGYVNGKESNILEKIKSKKKIIVILLILLIICLLGLFVYNKKVEQDKLQSEIVANMLTEEEEIGAKAVKILKSYLKNQDSLNVYEIWYRVTKTSAKQVLIDYSAQNGFGGSNRNIAVIENNKFWGNDSKADDKITKYKSQDEVKEILLAQGVRTLWEGRENEKAPFTKLNKDKIIRNLDKVSE